MMAKLMALAGNLLVLGLLYLRGARAGTLSWVAAWLLTKRRPRPGVFQAG